jgi:hypothetical protein
MIFLADSHVIYEIEVSERGGHDTPLTAIWALKVTSFADTVRLSTAGSTTR